jgi:hypothetical protein
MKIRELFEDDLEQREVKFYKNVKNLEMSFYGKKVNPNGKVLDEWDLDLALEGRNLTSLEGSPKKVKGYFSCSDNNLKSLEFGPREIDGDFYCGGNLLADLEFSPKKINGTFSCANTINAGAHHLISLKGITQEGVHNLNVSRNDKLTSLEGAPQKIDGDFICDSNKNITSLKGMPQEGVREIHSVGCSLTSFEGCPKKVERGVFATGNPIKNLKNIHKIFDAINGEMELPDSIESNILGLLKIKNLRKISFFAGEKSPIKTSKETKTEISNIINKYLPNPTSAQIIDCQNELIEAGFEEYAEL